MGLHLYLITEPSRHPPRDLTGVDGVAVEARAIDRLAVWTSTHAGPPDPSPSRLRAHDRVVRAAADVRTPLPVRFGQWFESVETLAGAIRERRDSYLRDLRELEGAVEFGIRLVATSAREDVRDEHAGGEADGPPLAASTGRMVGSGRAYMMALASRAAAEREARRREVQTSARVRAAAGPLVLRERVEARPDPACVVRLTHLVAAERASAYRSALERFAAEEPGLSLLVSGPWPPWSFVS